MNNSTLRIVSKAGFILVLIGFLMPFVLNQNGFQVAGYLSQFLGQNAVSYSLYAIFIISCAGVLLFILLLMKKEFNIFIDWIVISAAIISILIIFSEIANVLRSISNVGSLFGFSGAGRSLGNAVSEYLQFGAYMIIIGLIVSTVFQVVPFFNNSNVNSTKKCPFCSNEIKEETIVCQFCGKNVPLFIPTHKVKLFTNANGMSLRNKPIAFFNPFTKIPNNTEVKYLKTGEFAKLGDKEGEWLKIKTQDNITGWCFSGSLEKL
ncbi:MAG: SH3 domain-containing protein [Treponema sp.]|nr:SH3 domain-containing protein [Treponema sp.]MCL2273147.1 SH3 domain-containing protein [Treponema sp.]